MKRLLQSFWFDGMAALVLVAAAAIGVDVARALTQ